MTEISINKSSNISTSQYYFKVPEVTRRVYITQLAHSDIVNDIAKSPAKMQPCSFVISDGKIIFTVCNFLNIFTLRPGWLLLAGSLHYMFDTYYFRRWRSLLVRGAINEQNVSLVILIRRRLVAVAWKGTQKRPDLIN